MNNQGASVQKFNMFNQSQINLGQQPSSSQLVGSFASVNVNQSIAGLNPHAIERALRQQAMQVPSG